MRRSVLAVCGIVCALVASGAAWRASTSAVPASMPSWQLDGLRGTTVHLLSRAPWPPYSLFAATEDGVYRRSRQGPWQRVLAVRSVWSVTASKDRRTVLAAENSGYVDLSRDAGLHWSRHMLAPGGVFALSVSPSDPRHILAGADGGIYLSTNSGASWRRTLRLRGTGIDALTWNRFGTRVFAAGVAGSTTVRTGVYSSTDGGRHWQQYGSNGPDPAGVMSLAILPRGAVLAGTMGEAVWRTMGVHAAWTPSATGMPPTGDHVAAITASPGAGLRFVAATLGHGLYTTGDGRRWSSLSSGLQGDALIVLSVVYSPPDHALLAGTAAGIYRLPVQAVAK